MSIFVLVFAAVLLGLMDWSQSMMESWPVVAGSSTALFVAALLARNRILPRLFFSAGGILGFLALGAAFLVRFLVDWMNSNVQPIG